MELKDARITMLINMDYTEINIRDMDAATQFINIKITPEQLSEMLSRMRYVKCKCEVIGLDKIGKIHENKYHEFEIPQNLASNEEKLLELAIKSLADNNMEEWIPDNYFRGQNSFFSKDGKKYARVIIRRYVQPE